MNQTQYSGHPDTSNNEAQSLGSPFEVPPIGTPISNVRHNIGDRNQRSNFYGSSYQNMNDAESQGMSQVSYSYKNF